VKIQKNDWSQVVNWV